VTDEHQDAAGWFEGLDPGDTAGAATAIREGSADAPDDWPAVAVESGFADDDAGYYDALHGATLRATREAVHEAERADDKQLIHAIRAMDDCERVANELAERVAEWAGSRRGDAGTGVAYASATSTTRPPRCGATSNGPPPRSRRTSLLWRGPSSPPGSSPSSAD